MPVRLAEALDEADAHRISPRVEDDRDARRRPLHRQSRGGPDGVNHIDLLSFQTPGRGFYRL